MRSKFKRILIDICITIGVLFVITAICFIMRKGNTSMNPVKFMYVFAVVIIAAQTKGYTYGIVASVISVLLSNYYFMEPKFTFNFLEDGYPISLICLLLISIIISTLITRIRSNTESKIQAEKERMHANLLRAISHDLRSPLTSIAGGSRTIRENRDQLTEEQINELLDNVITDSEDLILMVENLLMITRVTGNVQLSKTHEAVEEIVGSALYKFKRSHPEIKLEASYPEQLLLVPMDATLFVQVLNNLFNNSVQHGGKVTKIDVYVTVDGKFAEFNVVDDGIGYHPSSVQDFDKQGRNMGIGLSLCKSIVEAHGGTFKTGNCPKGGARMTFTLPMQ